MSRTFTSTEIQNPAWEVIIEKLQAWSLNPAFLLHLMYMSEKLNQLRATDNYLRRTLRNNYRRTGKHTDSEIETLVEANMALQQYHLPAFRLTEEIILGAELDGNEVGILKLETYAP